MTGIRVMWWWEFQMLYLQRGRYRAHVEQSGSCDSRVEAAGRCQDPVVIPLHQAQDCGVQSLKTDLLHDFLQKHRLRDEFCQ